MFYIFNQSGKCIASADFPVNENDLATRGESVVEDSRIFDIEVIEYLDGKLREK